MGALYKRMVLEDGSIEYEHRVVAEKILGRKLMPYEEVHHIDENKRNNSEDNLIIFRTSADHTRFHNGGELVKNSDGTYSATSSLGEVIYIQEKNKKVTLIKRICQKCGCNFWGSRNRKYCSEECCTQAIRKVDKPSKEELLELLKSESFLSLGRRYGVSDNAVRKWCRGYGISDKSSDYREKKVKQSKKKRLLNIEKANEIRRLRKEFNYSSKILGEMFGASKSTINDVLANRTYVVK